MCNEENLHKYRDIRDDCKELDNFELGGVLLILFSVIGMLHNIYNAVSGAIIGYDLNLGPFTI